MTLSQGSEIDRALHKYGMEDCKAISNLMDKDLVVILRGTGDLAPDVPYNAKISSLLYCEMYTSTDIAYAVGTLAQFCEAPTKKHREMVKRLLRYMQGTKSTGPVNRRIQIGSNSQFVAYSDADWGVSACLKSTSRSTLFYRGCLVA